MAHTILIVDDDAATRDMLAQAMTGDGYDSMTAADVPAAMHLLTERSPDLLITDIRLDTYNGLQLIAMAPKPIPAIVLTGFADAAIEADARRLGAVYMVKPVSLAALCGVVERTLATLHDRVFISTRQSPRWPVRTAIPVVIGQRPATVVDVSEGGARLEVPCNVGAGLPSTLVLAFTSPSIDIRAEVAWKRRKNHTTWSCGVAVAHDTQPAWRSLVGIMTAPADDLAARWSGAIRPPRATTP
jgi:CheY-like chemotaxis protein